MVAWYKSTDHCASRPSVGSGLEYSNKVLNGFCAVSNVGISLFRCHAYGADSSRAANEPVLSALDANAHCRVLLGSITSLCLRGLGVEVRCSLHPASNGLVGDEGIGISLDGCMVVPDSAASGGSIPRAMVLALLYSAGESVKRTLRQRLVDLVTSVHVIGDFDRCTESTHDPGLQVQLT